MARGSRNDKACVVGRVQGEECVAVRLTLGTSDSPPVVLSVGRWNWQPGAALGDPLERLLGWSPGETVVIAVPTPLFLGGSLSLRWPRTAEYLQATAPAREAKRRERELHAAWETRERLRERAVQFFETSLADIQLLTEDLGPWREEDNADILDATALFSTSAEDQEIWTARPPDVDDLYLVLLPLLASEMVPSDGTGLFLLEEERASFALRTQGRLSDARSIPLGAEELTQRVHRLLGCSPREARALLERCDQGTLPPDATRAIGRVVRPLVPLFRAGLHLLTEDAMRSGGMRRLTVAGMWAGLVQRFLLGSHTPLTSKKGPVVPQLLASPEVQWKTPRGIPADIEGLSLVLLLAAAVARRTDKPVERVAPESHVAVHA